MNLSRQPPRRPSNTGMAGIAGLARTTDKARAHEAELLGEYLYGEASGFDGRVLNLLGIGADDFAEAAASLWDRELEVWVQQRMVCTQQDIDDYNQERLAALPKDEKHQHLLAERVEKYAPGSNDITTAFASMELDDWGCFRDLDLTVGPPRTAYLRSVAGIVAAARMADKARAKRFGKLGEYKYGVASFVDRSILEFLRISEDDFEDAAWCNPNDKELGQWLQEQASFTAATVSLLNEWLTGRGLHTPGIEETFRARRDDVCPERPEVKTYFELMDIDDEASFGIVDLNRRAPRSPFDNSLGGVYGLARMIDKGRAYLTGHGGVYWFGQDSGFDRRILDFLKLSDEEFSDALQGQATDAEVVCWLGGRLQGRDTEVADLNKSLTELSPSSAGAEAFLTAGVKATDATRSDVGTFMVLTRLDDEVAFARLRSRV